MDLVEKKPDIYECVNVGAIWSKLRKLSGVCALLRAFLVWRWSWKWANAFLYTGKECNVCACKKKWKVGCLWTLIDHLTVCFCLYLIPLKPVYLCLLVLSVYAGKGEVTKTSTLTQTHTLWVQWSCVHEGMCKILSLFMHEKSCVLLHPHTEWADVLRPHHPLTHSHNRFKQKHTQSYRWWYERQAWTCHVIIQNI